MTTSGHFPDTRGLAGCKPSLFFFFFFFFCQFVVAWADTQNSCGSQAGHGTISSIAPWRSARNFTKEANAHNCLNVCSEQHCLLAGARQGRHAWNFEQAVFERAPHDEVHVVSCTIYRNFSSGTAGKMGPLENQAEQTCTVSSS